MSLFFRYGTQFLCKWRQVFSKDRLQRYGLRLAVWEMAEFLGHRNFRSKAYHWIVLQKDRQVQRYLLNNFKGIWSRYHSDLN